MGNNVKVLCQRSTEGGPIPLATNTLEGTHTSELCLEMNR